LLKREQRRRSLKAIGNFREENRGQGVIIEKATVSDAGELLVLQKLAYRSEAKIYNDFRLPPLVQTLESMEEDFKNHLFLKAVIDGRIIGSVRVNAREGTCYIGRLIVHPDFQNRGSLQIETRYFQSFFLAIFPLAMRRAKHSGSLGRQFPRIWPLACYETRLSGAEHFGRVGTGPTF